MSYLIWNMIFRNRIFCLNIFLFIIIWKLSPIVTILFRFAFTATSNRFYLGWWKLANQGVKKQTHNRPIENRKKNKNGVAFDLSLTSMNKNCSDHFSIMVFKRFAIGLIWVCFIGCFTKSVCLFSRTGLNLRLLLTDFQLIILGSDRNYFSI